MKKSKNIILTLMVISVLTNCRLINNVFNKSDLEDQKKSANSLNNDVSYYNEDDEYIYYDNIDSSTFINDTLFYLIFNSSNYRLEKGLFDTKSSTKITNQIINYSIDRNYFIQNRDTIFFINGAWDKAEDGSFYNKFPILSSEMDTIDYGCQKIYYGDVANISLHVDRNGNIKSVYIDGFPNNKDPYLTNYDYCVYQYYRELIGINIGKIFVDNKPVNYIFDLSLFNSFTR